MRDKLLLIIASIILLAAASITTYYLLTRENTSNNIEQYSSEEKADIYHLIISGNLSGYSKYLEDGKKLSFAFPNNKTPLELLIEQNDILSAVKLIENGFDLTLVKNNHIDTVTNVLAHNELVQIGEYDQIAVKLIQQIKTEIENPDSYGYSLLISAIETNNYLVVNEALKYITNIDKNYNGESALTFACLSGETDVEIVKLLVNKGANINLQTPDGNSCLMKAVIYEQPELIQYLLSETSINVNLRNLNGQTALHIAVLYANFLAVEDLLGQENLNKNIIDNDGKTAKKYAEELKTKYKEYEEYINRL